RRVLVADREPERAGRLENAMHGRPPAARPVEVFVGLATIVVGIVFVADVEGRIGEGEVHRPGLQPAEAFDAIALVEVIPVDAEIVFNRSVSIPAAGNLPKSPQPLPPVTRRWPLGLRDRRYVCGWPRSTGRLPCPRSLRSLARSPGRRGWQSVGRSAR